MPGVASTLLALALAAPATLGDALRDVGAFEVRDHLLDAPPPPPRLGARVVIGLGGAMVAAGLVGGLVATGCATRDSAGRCRDAGGSLDVFPLLVVVGLATTTVGSYWFRRGDRP